MLVLLHTTEPRIAPHMSATLAEAGVRLLPWGGHAAEADALVADLDLLTAPPGGWPAPAQLPACAVTPGMPLVLLHGSTTRKALHRARAAGLPPGARTLRVPFAAGALVEALRGVGLVSPSVRSPFAAGVLAYGGLVLDPATGRTTQNFHSLPLAPRERLLLELLLRRAGTLVRKEDIRNWCLDYATPASDHAVDVLASRLRGALATHAGEGAVRLRTVRGMGYRLETA